MEVDKRSSKGGFLQLFDWNTKSRKKLFSNKSELPENSKQGKENTNGSSNLRLQQAHDYGPGSVSNQNYDYYIASSATEDGNYGQKAPGVVARLMGLDSLPTSKAIDPYFTPAFDCHSFRDSPYLNFVADFQNEHQMIVDDNTRNKLDGFRRNPVEQQKVQTRPIERFQSEVLPPKSAKPISVTQHRLLSPIKSPGFIPPKNAAYVMEAAAKIIEQSPRLTAREKMQFSGSSSVPLRIRDLKDKMEAAQRQSRIYEASHRPKEQSSVKHIRRQPIERGQVQSEEMRPFGPSEVSKRDVSRNKGKEKSVSLAVQAKTNVQKREGKTSTATKNPVNQKEQNASKSGRSRSSGQKVGERRTSLGRPSDVLRQNNQKQNSASNKDGESLKTSSSCYKEKKVSSTSEISRPTKTVNRIVVSTTTGSRTANFVGTDAGKEFSSSRESRLRSFTGKKQPVNEDICSDGNGPDNLLKSKDERSIKCNLTIEGCSNWDTTDRKNGSDVVSFTFTSPIKKSVPGFTSSSQGSEKRNVLSLFPGSYDDQSNSRTSTESSLGSNVIGADDLGMLLEQKLKELTSKVGSSCEDLVKTGTASISANSVEDRVSIIAHDKRHQVDLLHDKSEDYGDSSVDDLRIPATQMWLGPTKVEKQRSSFTCERDFSVQCSSPVSSLEPSISGGSCNSLDSYRSLTTDGGKYHLSDVSQEMMNGTTYMRTHLVEGETELLDSASSVSLAVTSGKDSTAASTSTDFDDSSYWEFGYIRDIIRSADLMLEGFVLGEAHIIIYVDLFDQLENQKTRKNKNVEERLKIRRRVLFDSVVECLEFRYQQSSGGSFEAWAKWTTLVQRKEWLAEEVYREIAGWTSMEDLMVDEVVDKDMSTQYGKWTDFSFEAFEEGVDIEKGILSSLMDELIHDLIM